MSISSKVASLQLGSGWYDFMTLYAVQTLEPCGANRLWPLRPLPFLHEVISLRAMAVTAHPSASISFIATLLSTGESLNGFILGKGRLTFNRFNVQSSDWMSFQSFQEDGAASHWPEPWCVGHLVIKIKASSFMTIGVRLQQNDLPLKRLKCRKFPAWLFWSCMIWARWGCLPSNPTWMGCHGIQSTPVAQERTQPKAPCLNGGQATDTQYLFGSVLKACMLKHCADPCCIALLNPRCCSTQRYYNNAEAALLESREPEPEACWHS